MGAFRSSGRPARQLAGALGALWADLTGSWGASRPIADRSTGGPGACTKIARGLGGCAFQDRTRHTLNHHSQSHRQTSVRSHRNPSAANPLLGANPASVVTASSQHPHTPCQTSNTSVAPDHANLWHIPSAEPQPCRSGLTRSVSAAPGPRMRGRRRLTTAKSLQNLISL